MNPLRSKRSLEVEGRIRKQPPAPRACAVLGCPGMTRAHLQEGLDRNYCSKHVAHYLRHGSYSKPSYRAADLVGPRGFALEWLRTNATKQEVASAKELVVDKYHQAGRPQAAFRLTGKPPQIRAKNTWAALAERQVAPEQLLAIWIAVQLAHQADPSPERKKEYRQVQAAKLLNRLAGGTHREWRHQAASGEEIVTRLSKYPASRGRVLRHLGTSLEDVARPLAGLLDDLARQYRERKPAVPRRTSRTRHAGTPG